MSRISKKKLTQKVAEKLGLTQKETKEVIDETINEIIEEVKKGNEVTFFKFGTFKEKIHKAKEGFNPKTKEKIQIPTSKTISFKVSSKLKEII